MNCGCCKNLGCFAYNQTIQFGINALTSVNPYIFHIWTNGTYQTQSIDFDPGDPIILPFTFNENSVTTIQIELPVDLQDPEHGINYVNTIDGSCCFEVHGVVSICQ